MASTPRPTTGRSRPATTRSSSWAAGPAASRSRTSLRPLGIEHAVISADPAPAACSGAGRSSSGCCRGPSRTRPAERHPREFERYDWNSLARRRAGAARAPDRVHGRDVVLPVAPRDGGRTSTAFAERAAIAVRYGCRWESTRREETAGRHAFVLETTDGEYRCQAARASRSASPSRAAPSPPGIELAATTPTRATPRPTRASGSSSSASRTRGSSSRPGLLQWASRDLVVARRRRPRLSIQTRSLVGVRARYVQPFEDLPRLRGRHPRRLASSGIDRRRRAASASTSSGPTTAMPLTRRGRRGHRRDRLRVPAARPAGPRCGHLRPGKLPAVTPFWESAHVPGIYFAGTIGQASRRPQEARHPGQLRRGPRRPLQRAHPRPAYRRAHFGIDRSAPLVDVGRPARLSPRRGDARARSCGTRRRTSRASSASPETASATRAILPLAHASTPGTRRDRDDRRGGRGRRDLPGRSTCAARAGRRSTRSTRTRCSSSRPATTGRSSPRSSARSSRRTRRRAERGLRGVRRSSRSSGPGTSARRSPTRRCCGVSPRRSCWSTRRRSCGRAGVERVLHLPLAADELEGLRRSAAVLRDALSSLERAATSARS